MSAAPVRILCIEDNPMNWRLVQRLLSQAGYEMHWAEDGFRGFELALTLKPPLILLDINLPGLSGFEVATKLRQEGALQDTLIVALTAKTLRNDRETALVTGCDGFIPKPIDPFLFVGQVEAYLHGQRDRLEAGREGVALRQFSRQVVGHLEAQLLESRLGALKLQSAQAELEQRSGSLSRLLALSRELAPLQDGEEILRRVLGQLRKELRLRRLRSYQLHTSGAYYIGKEWRNEALEQAPVLAADHPLVLALAELPGGMVTAGAELTDSPCWHAGIGLGLWSPSTQPLLLPLRSRVPGGSLWGFLAADRSEEAFLSLETDLAALHGGILQVSLENAGLLDRVDATHQALGSSYEGLEDAYEALLTAQEALRARDRGAPLEALLPSLLQKFARPLSILREEAGTAEDPEARALELPPPSRERIRLALDEVESLLEALRRRSSSTEAGSPHWLRFHTLLRAEIAIARAEGRIPEDVQIELAFAATTDRIFGVRTDFEALFSHLLDHATAGEGRHLTFRTSGGPDLLQLEVSDDGAPIDPALLSGALTPFPDLRPPTKGRVPGPGLAICAQLLEAYGGQLEILATDGGSSLRMRLPLA